LFFTELLHDLSCVTILNKHFIKQSKLSFHELSLNILGLDNFVFSCKSSIGLST
jgi:hypothetical protein